MATLHDQKGFKGLLPIIGLCLACFSIGSAISWYLMNSHYLRVKLDLEKAESTLGEVSKDLSRVKAENDGWRKLVHEKDDIINKIRTKEPENIGEQQKLIDQLKSDNNMSLEKMKQKQSELDNCTIELNKNQEKYKQLQLPKDTKGSDEGPNIKYEYKMAKGYVSEHNTYNFYNDDLSISITDIINNKINVIIGSKGYPNLRLNNKEVGDKINYNTSVSYEITINNISGNSVYFIILQKKKMR